MHFVISEGKGGLKHGSRPWLGMDIFWKCPLSSISECLINYVGLWTYMELKSIASQEVNEVNIQPSLSSKLGQ